MSARASPVDAAALMLGVEQEFELFAQGEKLDFRRLFGDVLATLTAVPFRNRALAAVVAEGYMLACDEEEAEFATAPVAVREDGCARLVAETARCREHLLSLLETVGVDGVRGYSTHLNVGVRATDRLASLVATTLGPALVLLLEGEDSPGLLIRPRPLRLEIVSEYVDDELRLLGALVLLAGVIPTLAALEAGPRAQVLRSERGTLRGGIFLPRDAYGEVIHEAGPASPVLLADGRRSTAGDLLAYWLAHAARELGGDVSENTAAALRDAELDVQRSAVGTITRRTPRARADEARALGRVATPPAGTTTRFVDWHGAAFGLATLPPSDVVGVPWSGIPDFLGAVASGTFVPPARDPAPLIDLSQLQRVAVFPGLDTLRLGSQAFFDFGAATGKKIECPLDVRIERIGDYGGDLSDHVDRPFYRRRLIEEQEGADLIVTPTSARDLGHEQHLVLRADSALELADSLLARVYTSEDRTSYIDFHGAPAISIDPDDPSVASIDVQADEPIVAIHLIGLRYRGLTRLPGHAVRVSVEPAGMPRCAITRVNLLLYEHDLGNAEAGNGTVAVLNGTDLLLANVTNGNASLQIPLFSWRGLGLSLACTLTYNSFHAAQSAAATLMGRLNELTPEDVDRWYARTTVGRGWAYGYGLHVLPYVISEGGLDIRRRLELVAGDGNHIQFEEIAAGLYAPAGRGMLFGGDPHAGMSLRLTVTDDGYQLDDCYGSRWLFDDEGRVTEIASLPIRRSSGALAPVTIDYADDEVTVTDSVGRTLRCERAADGQVVALRCGVDREWTLEPDSVGHLARLVWPVNEEGDRHVTSFQYDDTYEFMTSVVNRRGFETTIEHVPDGDAWGRVHRISRSDAAWQADWEPVLESAGVPGELATATITDARGTQRYFVWNRIALALRSEDALRPQLDDAFGSLDEGWIRLRSYEYFDEPGRGEGKLPAKQTDVYGIVQTTTYDRTHDGTSYLTASESLDGNLVFRFTYDEATNLVYEQTDAQNRTVTKTYDPQGNLAQVMYPRLADQAAAEPAHVETWRYAEDGRLLGFTDRGGYETTYGFDEGARDPFEVGLPTSRTRDGDTWQLTYEQSGSLTAIVEPFFAGQTDLGYDELDRLRTVIGPEAQIVTGGDPKTAHAARELWRTVYDANGNVAERQLPLGAGVTITYDEHDRPLTETNSDGTHSFDAYDGLGTLLRHTDRRHKTWETRADYLGRPRLIIQPQVQAGRVAELFRYPDDGKGHLVRYMMGPLAGDDGVGYPRRHAVTRYDAHSNVVSERRWTNVRRGVAPGTESAWIYERDVYGHLGAVSVFNSTYPITSKTQSVYREVYELDEWYRIKAVIVSGKARTDYGRSPLDEIVSVTTPPHCADATIRAEWRFGFDAHGRETTVTDPYGTVVRKTDYSNADGSTPATVEHYAIPLDAACPEPLEHRSGESTLALVKRETYNARGLVVAEEELSLPVVRSYYDERGLLVALERGSSSTTYSLDPQGRPRFTTRKEPAHTETVEQRFDEAGNRIYLSGREFSATYEYDSVDRFIAERRTPSDASERIFRTVTYDIFGRPVRKELEGDIAIAVTYDDLLVPAATYEARVRGQVMASVRASYHWSGRCGTFARSERSVRSDGTLGDLEEVLSVNTFYDGLARPWRVISYGFMGLLRGTVETEYFPAGTRKKLTVETDGSRATATKERFEQVFDYHPDWQVKSITSPHAGGQYDFRYQPNGCLSSWRTPRGANVVLEHDAYGAVSFVECRRPSGKRPYARSSLALYDPGTAEHPKQRATRFSFYHEEREFPDNGFTTYTSEATYNDLGLLDRVVHKRRGQIGPAHAPTLVDLVGDLDDWASLLSTETAMRLLGLDHAADPVDRTITNVYRADAERTLKEAPEVFAYPDATGDGFSVSRSYTRTGRVHQIESGVSGLAVQSFPFGGSVLNPNELVESRFRWRQTSRYDAYARLEYLVSRNLVTPTVFNLWGDARRWLHTHQMYSRDELGRVNGYSTITLRSAYDDPDAAAPLEAPPVDPENDPQTAFLLSLIPTIPPALGLLAKELKLTEKTTQDTGVRQRVALHRGPTGEVVTRTAVTINVDDKGHAHRFVDRRLYLYDGGRVIAEVNNGGELVRYYELGPGSDLRLSVLHKRNMRGNWIRTVDHYLYGAGMSSVGLVGRIQLPDDSFVEDKLVRRFSLFDMPMPGDGRRERVAEGAQVDALTLNVNSSLYVASAQAVRASLPPGVTSAAPAPIGSHLGTDVTERSFGMALPHHALLEDVFDPEPPLIDPAELPGPTVDTSVVARIERYLDWAMAWNPIWKLNRTKALVKEGRYDEAKELVVQATIQLIEWVLCQPFDMDAAALRPTVLTALLEVKNVYDEVQLALSIPDMLNLVNGFDPKTGEAYSVDDRILGLVPPPDPIAFLQHADTHASPYGMPKVHSGDGCFPAETLVWTRAGLRPIAELEAGDIVVTSVAGRVGEAMVDAVHEHVNDTMRIELDSEAIVASPPQPLLRADGTFVEARGVRPGDRLLDARGEAHAVARVTPGPRRKVLNLTVGGDHTYLVGAAGIVAHNKGNLQRDTFVRRNLGWMGGEKDYWGIAFYLLANGWHEQVWQLPAVHRGAVAENMLAIEGYRRHRHVGAERGGTNPTYDFERSDVWTSVKSVDPLGGRRIGLKKAWQADRWTPTEFAEEVDKHVSAILRNKRGTMVLHVIVPGEVLRNRDEWMRSMGAVHARAKRNNVSIIFRNTRGGWMRPRIPE